MPVIDNVTCTQCGCVCDDLRVTVEGDRITKVEPGCSLAEPWFLNYDPTPVPVAEVEGVSVPLEVAFQRTTQILNSSRSPLIYGLSRSSTPGQRAAVALADGIGATIDTTASLCHAPSVLALQAVGESTCTLGEVKNRADLVIFWGTNPLHSHPRHTERYSTDPVGLFVPNGRADRTVVVVDVAPTATSDIADIFIQVKPGTDFDALWTMRGLLRGHQPTEDSEHGAPLAQLADLVERMKKCRFGIVFFGLGLSMSGLGHRSVEGLLALVTELNDYTRFYARRMRVHGDVAGADSVLAWQTGFPFSVNLGRGYPRYNPGEFSAKEMLERREVDACVLVGSESIAGFSDQALAHLRTIPTIALEYPRESLFAAPTVRFTTAIYGLHEPGTAYRMDEVPIPLRMVVPSHYPTDEAILTRLAGEAAQSCAPGASATGESLSNCNALRSLTLPALESYILRSLTEALSPPAPIRLLSSRRRC